MKTKTAFILPLLLILIPVSLFAAKAGKSGGPNQADAITITLPAAVIEQAIKESLPLPVKPLNDNFKGSVTVDSVTNLRIYKNALSLQAHITGRNMKVTTMIAGRNIALNVGTVSLPVAADFLLRFDGRKKILFVKPRMQPPGKTLQAGNPADMLQLLIQGLAGREYPVALNNLQPLTARIGGRTLSVRMRISDIQTRDNTLIMHLTPRVRKGSG